jgi:death-on-curing protein
MRTLNIGAVLKIHRRAIALSGGSDGLRDLGSLESAIAQPRMTFGGVDLYRSWPIRSLRLGSL